MVRLGELAPAPSSVGPVARRNGLVASQARTPANPNGIASPSPRLACNAYLGCTFGNRNNANGVVARANRANGNGCAATALWLDGLLTDYPR